MALYAWPLDLGPSTVSFFLEHNAQRLESPLSRASQVLVRPGARWVCRMEFARRDAPRAARLDALLALLDGPGEEVTVWDFRREAPRGVAGTAFTSTAFSDATTFSDGTRFVDYTSAPTLSAATLAGAETAATSGWQANATVLLAGDYVGLGGHLYMVVEDVRASGTGAATLRLRPRLRAASPAGARVALTRVSARFRLADNSQGENRTEAGLFSSYAVTLYESLP